MTARERVEEAITAYGKAAQDFTRRLGDDNKLTIATGDLLVAIDALVAEAREECDEYTKVCLEHCADVLAHDAVTDLDCDKYPGGFAAWNRAQSDLLEKLQGSFVRMKAAAIRAKR